MEKINTISLFNEDGTPKNREDFLQEMLSFYDTYIEPEDCDITSPLFSACTTAEKQIDTESVIKTFNFRDKSILIDEEITEKTSKMVVNQIRFWNAVDAGDPNPDPIIIYIDTVGGNLDATLSIIAAIKTSNVPVYTINCGKAWSGGFFILISGEKRFAMPYSSYLFHEGSNIVGGDAHKVFQQTDFYKSQIGLLRDITLENTSIGEALYEKHRKDDWWFGNDTATKYNVVDKIMTSIFDFEIDEEEDND